jgi:hypothetical protein
MSLLHLVAAAGFPLFYPAQDDFHWKFYLICVSLPAKSTDGSFWTDHTESLTS